MRWSDRVLLAFLVIDGFVVGVMSVAFAYVRFGGIAIPVAAVLAGIVNSVLLWLASTYTDGPVRYFPLLAWLLALVIGALPGPGGDVELLPDGVLMLPTLALLAIGAGLPAVVAWSGRLPTPDDV
ncbi:facilitated glucose transporter [Gordonia sp. SL306]|uniref:facilitated glucose transporter n=1 Tax=Gordonia sp. SL306 TaxID=2995145 RepID=UPI002270179D|nr:facilitated glucose transporter [Gordonia sp. SL306]WAC56141.1 facilitated glucose transporter [Gordonia sp. SL306]